MLQAILIFLFCGACVASAEDSFKLFNPDEQLTTPQIVRRHGYPSEVHIIVTEDGYLLSLHRIPHGKNTSCTERQVILLQHGFLSSSVDWVLIDPAKSLGYILADNCYDVWMGNSRGNLYSRGHVNMSMDDVKYWDYSWHEMGVYDLPASIDYILQLTNAKTLYFVGHSMGTTSFFTMASSRPEYGSKVKAMIALAPIVYVSHIKSPIRLLAPWANDFQFLATHLGDGEIVPTNKLMNFLWKMGCELIALEREICTDMMFAIAGFDKAQFNMTLFPLIVAHHPGGCSTKTIVHYGQNVKSGKFQQFDYGKQKNLDKYGTREPPVYNLTNIVTPVALYYGDNDWLSSIPDLKILWEQLPRKIGKFLVPFPGFNHIDFIYGKDAHTLIYDPLLKLLKTV